MKDFLNRKFEEHFVKINEKKILALKIKEALKGLYKVDVI